MDDVFEGQTVLVADCVSVQDFTARINQVVEFTSASHETFFQLETDVIKSLKGIRKFSHLIEVYVGYARVPSWYKLFPKSCLNPENYLETRLDTFDKIA